MSVELIDCLNHSRYTPGRTALSGVYRLYDPKVVGSDLDSASLEIRGILFSIMVPLLDSHILSESL